MLTETRKIRMSLAMLENNISTLLKEREQFIKELEKLNKEKEDLLKEIEKFKKETSK